MARFIVWEIKIGGSWISVTEKTFINTMHLMKCDHVNLRGGKTRFSIFYDKNGYPIGKAYLEEV